MRNKKIVKRLVILLFTLGLCFNPLRSILLCGAYCRDDPTGRLYLDKVFSPPTEEEIGDAYSSFPKDYSAQGFKITEKIYEDEYIIVEKIEYESEGYKITGLLAQPNISGKLPLIIYNHGGFSGLTEIDRDSIYELAEKGYIVLASTYRGEKGIAGQSEGEVGFLEGEVTDVLNLLECGKRLPQVKRDKIGMLGGSHGGGITLLAIERTRELSCALVFSAPANMLNQRTREMVEGWIKDPSRQEMMLSLFITREAMGKMSELLKGVAEGTLPLNECRRQLLIRSPLYFVPHISCPLLFFYGGKDPVVSVEDAKSLVEKLSKLGKTFEYKIYPQQGHGIVGKDRREVEKMIDKFLDKYMK